MNTQQLLSKAIVFAMHAHRGQTRKYTGEPYITHPVAVGQIVADVGGTPEMVAGAYLHDVVEDCEGYTHDIIMAQFGPDVHRIVHGMTKVDVLADGNREVRKANEVARLVACDAEVQTVKYADLIHNRISIVLHDLNFAKIYLREAYALAEQMVKGDKSLRKQLYATIEAGQHEIVQRSLNHES